MDAADRVLVSSSSTKHASTVYSADGVNAETAGTPGEHNTMTIATIVSISAADIDLSAMIV